MRTQKELTEEEHKHLKYVDACFLTLMLLAGFFVVSRGMLFSQIVWVIGFLAMAIHILQKSQ